MQIWFMFLWASLNACQLELQNCISKARKQSGYLMYLKRVGGGFLLMMSSHEMKTSSPMMANRWRGGEIFAIFLSIAFCSLIKENYNFSECQELLDNLTHHTSSYERNDYFYLSTAFALLTHLCIRVTVLLFCVSTTA